MTTISEIKTELLAASALSEKSTPGPWNVSQIEDRAFASYPHISIEVDKQDGEWLIAAVPKGDALEDADAAFIAASRTLTPKMAKTLLAIIEQAEIADDEMIPDFLRFICAAWEDSK